jgi:hypothetical protein
MAERYNQDRTVREEVRPYKLTSSSEESTSEGREESATGDFARPKQ